MKKQIMVLIIIFFLGVCLLFFILQSKRAYPLSLLEETSSSSPDDGLSSSEYPSTTFFTESDSSLSEEPPKELVDIEINYSSKLSLQGSKPNWTNISVDAGSSCAVKYKATCSEGFINDNSHYFSGYIDESFTYSILSDFERDTIKFLFYDEYGRQFHSMEIRVIANDSSYELVDSI